MEEVHSPFSPSSLERVMACTASWRLHRQAPTPPERQDALEGRAAHSVLEACLRAGVWRASEYANMLVETGTPAVGTVLGFEVRDKKAVLKGVQLCLDYVKNLIAGKAYILLPETRVHVPLARNPGDADGTADIMIYLINEGHLILIDYKNGVIPVPYPAINPQIKAYVAGALLYAVNILKLQPKRITGVVVQPNTLYGADIQEDEFYEFELELFLAAVDDKIDEARGDHSVFAPGEDTCRWCNAKAACPALREQAASIAGSRFAKLKEFNADHLPSVDDLTEGEIAAVLRSKKAYNTYVAAVEERAKMSLTAGKTVPGYKLVHASVRRKLDRDPRETAEYVSYISGVPLDRLMPRKLLSLTDLEGLVVSAYKDGVTGAKTRREAAKAAKEAFAQITTKDVSTNLTIAPDTDDRPEVTGSTRFAGIAALPPPPKR